VPIAAQQQHTKGCLQDYVICRHLTVHQVMPAGKWCMQPNGSTPSDVCRKVLHAFKDTHTLQQTTLYSKFCNTLQQILHAVQWQYIMYCSQEM
jgi:hypothetical protein